jgi:Flp pilus assembly protein TadG
MTIASINKPSTASTGVRNAIRSLKFERTGQPSLHDKSAIGVAPGGFAPGGPIIPRSILLPLHACDLSRVAEPHSFGDVMKTASIFSKLSNSLAKFKSAQGGNVAVMFAIAIVPIIGFVGAAIDYSRANNARTAMQAALDSTALMLSKDVTTLSASDINKKAQDYFNALYKHPEALNLSINAAYTNSSSTGSKIVMTASATMNTAFMKVVGYPTMDFGASSTTVWGTTKLRVALVLDNTGSMSSSGKMTALKTSANSLIDQLSSAAKNNGDVYISIIPFAKDVNVGSANYTANWIKWSGQTDTFDENNGSCNKKDKNGNTITDKATCLTRSGGVWTTANHNTWNGCVTDRDNTPAPGYDVLSTAPSTATSATLFPAEQYDSCPTAIMPLSYDWTGLKAKITSMQPSGGTNQAIGLAWGWLSLLQQSPLNAPAEDANFKYTKALILLSDGDNTQDRWPAYGNGSSQYTCQPGNVLCIDARQKLLCDNAKAAGITIYTIQVNTDGTNTSPVMSYCASGTNNYFATTSASGINTAFSSIGTALSKLRIAQ